MDKIILLAVIGFILFIFLFVMKINWMVFFGGAAIIIFGLWPWLKGFIIGEEVEERYYESDNELER